MEDYPSIKPTTCIAYHKNAIVFRSTAAWLYPIFELEAQGKSNNLPFQALHVWDKLIGKAAALLLVRLGIQSLHAGIISSIALTFLRNHNIHLQFDTQVAKISCRTETLLLSIEDPEKAYAIIRKMQPHPIGLLNSKHQGIS